jgi:hypothetical protein
MLAVAGGSTLAPPQVLVGVGAAMLSTLIYPFVAMALRRRGEKTGGDDALPSRKDAIR